MAKFTDEELAMLTEDERREIEALGEEYDADNEEPPMDPDDDDDSVEEEGGEGDAADEGDDGDGEDDADDADDPDAEGDETPAGEDDADAGGDGDEGAAEAPEPVAAEQQAPLLEAELPEGYEEKLKEFESQREKLDVDFDDGELTSLEYRKALREIESEEKALRDQVLKAQIAQDMQVQQQKQEWAKTVNSFLDDNDLYRQSETLYDSLNKQVIAIANSDEAAGLTGQQILEKAHERVLADPVLGRVFGDKEEENPEGKQASGKKLQRRNVPPTLGKVPAADMTSAEEGGRFARLDKMDGLELEAELARLSSTNPKLVDEYLSR